MNKIKLSERASIKEALKVIGEGAIKGLALMVSVGLLCSYISIDLVSTVLLTMGQIN